MQDPTVDKYLRWARRNSPWPDFPGAALSASFLSGTYTDAELRIATACLSNDAVHRVAERALWAALLGSAKLRPAHRSEAARTLACALQRRTVTRGVTHPLCRECIPVGILIGIACGMLWAAVTWNSGLLFAFACVVDGLVFGVVLVPILSAAMALVRCVPGAQASRARVAERCLIIHALGELRVPQSVPLLALACLGAQRYPGPIPDRALSAALESLRPEHRERLGPPATRLLCRLLADRLPVVEIQGPVTAFCRDLLTALETIGDGSAVPTVREIARKTGSRALADQALEVLRVLEARCREELVRDTLLRAAAPPVAGPSELLRACKSAAHPVEDLLMPAGR
jgi:hypothetical protein